MAKIVKGKPHAPQLEIIVDETTISHSQQRQSSHCMIAEALHQIVPNARSISVDLQTIRFSDPEKRLRYTYLTPRIAQVNIIKFDQGELPEPFDFRLRGGQVTKMMSYQERNTPQPRLPLETDGSISTSEIGTSAAMTKGSERLLARRVGGKPPPLGNLAKRRAFGLRALEF
jgi:hypothetical protein